jgi:hypothetical protein
MDAQPLPPLGDLLPLASVGRLIGLTLERANHWRRDSITPLAAWKVGGRWMSTEAAARDFILRRTAKANGEPIPGPVDSKTRKRQIDEAVSRFRSRGSHPTT